MPGLTSGHPVLIIDGTTANTPAKTYGIFEVGVYIKAHVTNLLPFTIWMPLLDMAHATTIPSPTTKETVITTPLLPGLELHLPAGTVIRDINDKVVTTVSITPVPIDRPPFPLPAGVEVPIYFTIQPGEAYLEEQSGSYSGAWLIYPNLAPVWRGRRKPLTQPFSGRNRAAPSRNRNTAVEPIHSQNPRCHNDRFSIA